MGGTLMKRYPSLVLFFVLAVCGVAQPAARPNVLFIAIDDLRNDLGALGAVHAKTPALDAFAATARVFSHHYVQVPTCGASRAALLRGRYPTERAHITNGAIANTHLLWGEGNLPAWFKRHGYRTLALGKITHHPGGLTGRNWAEPPEELPASWDRSWLPRTPWPHAEGIMHGFAQGRPRVRGESPALEAVDGDDHVYPDAWIADEAVATLRDLARADAPWFFAVGFFKPHLPFAAPRRYFDQHDPETIPAPAVTARPAGVSSWHDSGEFNNNYAHDGRDANADAAYARALRHAYVASTTYVDAQVSRVMAAVRELGLEDDTVVVVWSDHGFLLGEHAIWGKHSLYENALRSPLMIRSPGLGQPGRTASAVVETVDLFPTLTELCGLPTPAGLDGRSLTAYLRDPALPLQKPAVGLWSRGQRTVRTERWRLIAHPASEAGGGRPAYELFDFAQGTAEAVNLAEAMPNVVESLIPLLPRAVE
jgi:iduronate 2-sulfatase